MLRWIRFTAFAVLAWVMACGCSLGTQPLQPTAQASATPFIIPTLTTPTPTRIIATVTAFPTQIPQPTAIPLPVLTYSGNYGTACVVTPAQTGGTVNVRTGPGTTYGAIALMQTWAPVVGSRGGWYLITLPKGLTRYDTGWVSGTVVTLSAGCNPATATPTITPTQNSTCRFVPSGNPPPTTATLRTAPNGQSAFIVPAQTLTILAQQGNWFQVISSVTGQSGWLPDNEGYIVGNCSAIPQATNMPQESQACLITVGIDSPVYSAPNVPSTDAIMAGGVVRAIVRTDTGWYGYKTGLIAYDGSDLKTLMWVPYGNPLGNVNTGTAACNTLPLVVYPTP